MNIEQEMAKIMDELAIADKEYEKEREEKAEKMVERRRDAEFKKDLRGMGIDLRDLEGLV